MCADGRMFSTWPEPVVREEFEKPVCSKQTSTEAQSASVGTSGGAVVETSGTEPIHFSHLQSSKIWLATAPSGHKYFTREDAMPVSLQQIIVNNPGLSLDGVPCSPQHSVETTTKRLNLYSATDPVSQEVNIHV